MMDESNIQKHLHDAKDPAWLDRRLKALRKLPKKKRESLRGIAGKPGKDDSPATFHNRRTENAKAFFAELSEKERSRLWNGLFPSLAPHVEHSWEHAGELPYQHSYNRIPFRAPNAERIVLGLRSRFFVLLCDALQGLDPDPEWLAAWAPHIASQTRDPQTLGWVLASILRGGGPDAEKVRSVLIDSINGDHEVGRMGRHAIIALLNSDERTDWEIIGRLLLAAQRQEGLRQSILEAADEANPDAFRYMLGLILEHNLGRFSSVVRALDVWLGYQWAGGSAKPVHDGVTKLCLYMDDDGARLDAINGADAEDAYLALHVSAYRDATEALDHARRLTESEDPAIRYAALLMAARIRIVPGMIDIPVRHLLSGRENDERILTLICVLIAGFDFKAEGYPVTDELFEAVKAIYHRFPAKKKPLANLIWPWDGFVRERHDAAMALRSLAVDNPKEMLPYADAFEGYQLVSLIHRLAGIVTNWNPSVDTELQRNKRTMDADERAFVVRMMTDTRQDVHNAAFRALKGTDVTPEEVDLLTRNLHRTGATFRRGAIERLLALPPERVLEVGESLLDDKHAKRKAAGLELLSTLASDKRLGAHAAAAVEARAGTLENHKDLRDTAATILGGSTDEPTIEDCFGLVPPGSRAKPITPRDKGLARETDAAKGCVKSLAELFLEHAETEIPDMSYETWTPRGEMTRPLATYFPVPRPPKNATDEALAAFIDVVPLKDVWLDWINGRGKALRDGDGLELIRAWALVSGWDKYWENMLPAEFRPRNAYQMRTAFQHLVEWLPLLCPHEGAFAYLAQCAEDWVAEIAKNPKKAAKPKSSRFWKPTLMNEYMVVDRYLSHYPLSATDHAALARHGALRLLSMDLGHNVRGPSIDQFVAAYDAGLANEHDYVWYIMSRRGEELAHPSVNYTQRSIFGPINKVIKSRPPQSILDRPRLIECGKRVRDRLIEVELTRGERSTDATMPAAEIVHAGGAETMLRLVAALGRDKIIRQDQWGEPTRAYSFSRLIFVTSPREGDSDERFGELVKASGIKTARMLEVAMYAPQWARHIERATGSIGLEEAVWWIHAHTKRRDMWRNPEIREVWTAEIKERTELDAEDLEEGAVDVAWFNRIVAEIGVEGWEAYLKPAKYASNSGGHKRAQLYADTMLGRVTSDEILARIDEKRHQDAVRALGLAPLPKGAKASRTETLRRYTRLQEFIRESRKFGNQRQASERRAVEIGMQNLARTAGYRDPQRLQWAMEAEAVADLAEGPATVTVEETSVSLAIDESGAPEFTVLKKGKALKSVPAKLRKHEEIAELKSRVTDLRRQASRMRLSLEASMCRGDVFSGSELAEFLAHPMLRPMVERLVFVKASDPASSLVGYPAERGKVLIDHDGKVEPVGSRDELRLAHPSDLYARGDWHEWQRDCFRAERVQPFKQVFRELYPRTKQEDESGSMSRRYAGHQVNPRQALALLKTRQWVFAPEEGCRRVYHDEGLVAELWFQQYFNTPAEVEDLTLEGVGFRKKREKKQHVPLSDVPDRVFSETMRDLDLVVSVAHSGGVDPEASASTVEMRTTLLRETWALLNLNNVRVDGRLIKIDGTKASYSVHLGSGTTTILPGRVLMIVAVHSQYRGRLFLPFADDDPKTAEIMAKTLLLARDHEIKDPTIIEQILGT